MTNSDNVREMLETVMPDTENRANMIRSLSFLLLARLTEGGYTDITTVMEQYQLVEGLVKDICGDVPELPGASELVENIGKQIKNLNSLSDVLKQSKYRGNPSDN